MSIKEILQKQIDKVGNHPFLFVGAGLSKRYLKVENWEELLRYFATQIDGDEFKYDYYINSIDEQYDYYGIQPQIATLLEKDYNLAVLSKDEFKEFRNRNRELIKNRISPFKIAIAEHLENINIDAQGEEIELLKKLAVRNISGIITTNYDLFLESIFSDYKVYAGQEELIFSDIFQIGEIYKIHGCVTNPKSIVITSKDYADFESQYTYLIAKILTIFLEYPVIFIGYSIQDINIQNILKAIATCLSQDKLDILKERLIFIEYDNEKEKISTYSKTFENGNIIEMTKISTNDFSSIYKGILANKAKYNPKVLRKLRQDIYTLATNTDPKGSGIVAVGFENIDKIDENTNFIIGVGVSKTGYTGLKADEIYEDIILDNKYYDINGIIEESLPDLLKSNSGGLPMYKYLKDYSKPIFGKVTENFKIHNDIESFLNKQLIKQKINYRNILKTKSIESIVANEEMENAYKKIYFLDEKEIDVVVLEQYLGNLLKGDKKILKGNSELKRLIRIYDWLKYKK